jgi:hypothetical protein
VRATAVTNARRRASVPSRRVFEESFQPLFAVPPSASCAMIASRPAAGTEASPLAIAVPGLRDELQNCKYFECMAIDSA